MAVFIYAVMHRSTWSEEKGLVPMIRSHYSPSSPRSDEELALMVINVAEAAHVDGIICITESGLLAQHLCQRSGRFRIITTTTNHQTHDTLTKAGLEVIRLPFYTADKYAQIRHAIVVALRSGSVSIGDLIVCAIGHDVYREGGNLIVLTEMETRVEKLAISDLLTLTDGIQPKALEAAITVACKIGRAALRGKRIGAIFMLGDSLKAQEGSKQLVPNPFQGHEKASRMLTNPDIHDALVELSKLDGAFVCRGDGFIQAAGVFLTSPATDIKLLPGLGARHAAAAAVTMRSKATAIVVSATDGNVRVFSGGRMVLQIDPDVSHGQISLNEQGF
ncbi:MAG: diadenylate cyclase [Desulfobacteraceae bacterium]|nr:diadenylate cyclase [Desulfobacteraceae bacterium]